jgi:hypothetical protein
MKKCANNKQENKWKKKKLKFPYKKSEMIQLIFINIFRILRRNLKTYWEKPNITKPRDICVH